MKHAELANYIRRLQFQDSREKRIADLDALLRRTTPAAAGTLANPMALPGMREFADDCPDLLQHATDAMKITAQGIYVPPNLDGTLGTLMRMHLSGTAFWSVLGGVIGDAFGVPPMPEPEPEPATEPFETNMVEPLVGWRTWWISKGRIRSINTTEPWPTDYPLVARCKDRGKGHKADIPRTNCTCGIYASDLAENCPEGHIIGTVYGWGRYVRGDQGWRSEFAYPREFNLVAGQATPDILDVLRQYHVPIKVDVPTQVYDPLEDGYENGYREAEAHGDCGADSLTDARQATGTDGDADDADDDDHGA